MRTMEELILFMTIMVYMRVVYHHHGEKPPAIPEVLLMCLVSFATVKFFGWLL